MARWVPYLLFLKDFRVTTAQMTSKSAVLVRTVLVSENSSYSQWNRDSADSEGTLELSQSQVPAVPFL